MHPFALFGADHLAALGAVAAGTVGLVLLVRRRGPAARAARAALAGYLFAATVVVTILAWVDYHLRPRDLLPLHICDLAIFLACFTLLTGRQVSYEVLYFWALGATLPAMLTPDLGAGFPDRDFLSFFGIHGGVVAAALALTIGAGMRPRPGAAVRVFFMTNAYAILVGAVNVALGTNYMYLREKPHYPTLLDQFGPWPWYLLVVDGLLLILFLVLALPFRRVRDDVPATGPSGTRGPP